MRTLDLLLDGCQRMFGGIAELLPQSRAPSPFTIPPVYTLPDPRILIERICATWWEQTFVDAGLFVEVCRRIYINICEVSGVVPGQETKRPLKFASKSTEPLDEVAAYFDSNMDDFLTEARKYKCGCVFAHQFLDRATPALKASLAANTTIKFAGGVSTSDARALASDMRTTADFILSQPRLHFGCHIRNVTSNAVSIPVPVGVLERQPKLTDDAYEKLRERNRLRVSLPQPVRGTTFTFEETMGSQTANDPPGHHHEFRPEPQTSNDPSAASEKW